MTVRCIIRAWLWHWRQCLEAWAEDRATDAFVDVDHTTPAVWRVK